MPIVRRIAICAVGEMAPGSTRAFSYGPATKGIAYNREGVVKAYVNRCTHMGGPSTCIMAERSAADGTGLILIHVPERLLMARHPRGPF